MTLTVRDRGLSRILRGLRSQRAVLAQAGVQAGESQRAEGEISNVQLAVVHEFGSPIEQIPARSFMRSTVDEQSRKYFRLLLKGVRRTVDSRGRQPIETTMGQIAEVMAADIKKKIRSNVPPPLSPKYARRKQAAGKGSNTLFWSGQLLNSITPRVEKL